MEHSPSIQASSGNLAVGSHKGALVGENIRPEPDELHHQVLRHREELRAIDAQIAKLEETIDLEQHRLKEAREGLAEKQRLRSRLLLVRNAMSKFVQGLQARE